MQSLNYYFEGGGSLTSAQPIGRQQVCHLVGSSEFASGSSVFHVEDGAEPEENSRNVVQMAFNLTEEAPVDP